MNNFSAVKLNLLLLHSLLFIICVLCFSGNFLAPQPTQAQAPTPLRRVNVPYFNGNVPFYQMAVFWFGQVNNTNNYADVRAGYNNNELVLHLTIFDHWLWYDTSPTIDDLTKWDGATLYLNLDGNTGNLPTPKAYRFDAQLNHWQARTDYQAAYQDNGSGWAVTSIPFTTTSDWRGNGLNDGSEARGWTVEFHIPFTSLGSASPPPPGSNWGLALALNDRDDAAGAHIPDQIWPEMMDPQRPTTWGQLVFSLPGYSPPLAASGGIVTLRHGWDGLSVADAHIGGHSTCGAGFDPNFFNGWGDANYYAHYDQINIQNQSDVADWPCFSKYYVTFPLDALPPGKAIISATLTMYQFGNAGAPGQAQPSLIQALTIAEDWDEATLTWNNAPLAIENVAATWVNPLATFPGWPGVAAKWDVSRAVARAYTTGSPLRLVLYSADNAYHSGKYFVSSDTGDWNAAGRPTLQVLWGDPVKATAWVYLPLILRR